MQTNKMREALTCVLDWLKRMNAQPLNALAVSELTPSYAVNRTAKSIIEDNDYHISQLTAALAAPLRNCDVGTVEEQEARFGAFCKQYSKDGARGLCNERCPILTDYRYRSECALAWAQMPYNEGDKNGND